MLKYTRADANHAGYSMQKIGEATLSQTHSAMGESTGKSRKRYVDRLLGKLKTCLIHSPGHSSDECKVTADFYAKYSKS